MSDNINHPSHYTQGGIECIDAIKASMTYHEYAGYLKGNCIKYLWRYRNKGRAVEDLKKAQWYLDRLISENECMATVKQGDSFYWPANKENMAYDYVDGSRMEVGQNA